MKKNINRGDAIYQHGTHWVKKGAGFWSAPRHCPSQGPVVQIILLLDSGILLPLDIAGHVDIDIVDLVVAAGAEVKVDIIV